MTIEDNKKYKLTGEQIKDLASRISILSSESDEKAEKPLSGNDAPTTSTPGQIGQLYIQSDGTVYILKSIVEESGQPDEYTWEEVGAGGPTVVQTTGTSTTDVMSQKAVTSMVFADPSIKRKVQIGVSAQTSSTADNTVVIGPGAFSYGSASVVLGSTAKTYSYGATALGTNAYANADHSIALGDDSTASAIGEMAIGTKFNHGYNSSNYRLLTGLYDGQNDHDAVTVGQLNTAIAGAGAAEINSTDWSALWQ